MGILNAYVDWNKKEKQIDIKAVANDGPTKSTLINGYVSPERNYIDLEIQAIGTRIEFIKSFTSSFISDINGEARGAVRLYGPLSTSMPVRLIGPNGTGQWAGRGRLPPDTRLVRGLRPYPNYYEHRHEAQPIRGHGRRRRGVDTRRHPADGRGAGRCRVVGLVAIFTHSLVRCLLFWAAWKIIIDLYVTIYTRISGSLLR